MSETKSLSHQHIDQDSQPADRQDGPLFHDTQFDGTLAAHPTRAQQILRFLRHFGEMMLAMLLGMAAFDGITGLLSIPLGPVVSALGMAVAMTVPMVAWMRMRKHAWRLNTEMAGAMIVPTVLLIGASRLGVLSPDSLMMGTHILMVPSMLAVMLYRWRDYTCH